MSAAASQRAAVIGAALLAAVAWILTSAAPVSGQSPPADGNGTWTMKAPLPAARAEVAAAALDGKLHVIGGWEKGTAGLSAGPYHDEYDPATDTWRARAPLPEGRDHVALAIAGGKLYAFGGFVAVVHKGAGSGAFEYDPAADTWRALPPMKAPRGSAGAAAVDGKIHVIGGRGLDGVVVATHEVYDPQTNKWSDATPLPAPRDHLAVITVDGKIHAIGGRFKTPIERTGLHEVYDTATYKWYSAAPLPTPRSGVASAYYRGLIMVLGGELPPDHTFPENEGYDPKTDQWTTLAPMPHGRHGFGGAAIGDNAYFVGGNLDPGGGGPTDQLIMFHLP
jgi:N-acetylneuraminic acid mutarotase